MNLLNCEHNYMLVEAIETYFLDERSDKKDYNHISKVDRLLLKTYYKAKSRTIIILLTKIYNERKEYKSVYKDKLDQLETENLSVIST